MLIQLSGEVPYLRPNSALQSRMDENSLNQMREHARMLSLNAMERHGRIDLLEYERIKQEKKVKLKLEKEKKELEKKSRESQTHIDSKIVSEQMSNFFSGYYQNSDTNLPDDSRNSYYFDYNSGYYVYPLLGLYYHPITQLYYSWDSNKNEYICHNCTFSDSNTASSQEDEVIIVEDQKKVGPVKFAISKTTSAPISKSVSTVMPVLIPSEMPSEDPVDLNTVENFYDDLGDSGEVDYSKLLWYYL